MMDYSAIITFSDGSELLVSGIPAASHEMVTDVILKMDFELPVMKVVVIENGS